jgi:hypothetical protein
VKLGADGKLWREKKRQKNLEACIVCFKCPSIEGRSYCFECQQKMLRRAKLRYRRRKRKGVCTNCGRKRRVRGRPLCSPCNEQHTERQHRRRGKLREAGLCISCGKVECAPKAICQNCQNELHGTTKVSVAQSRERRVGGNKMDRDLKRLFDSQEEIDPRQFIRIVGQKPLRQSIRCSWLDEAELFARTFGPPETVNDTRYWNFVMPDGKPRLAYLPKQKQRENTRKLGSSWPRSENSQPPIFGSTTASAQ